MVSPGNRETALRDLQIDQFARALTERFGWEACEVAHQQANAASTAEVKASWSAIVAKITELTGRLPTTDHSRCHDEPDGRAIDRPGQ
jgi:hypothetical protein